MHVNAYVCDVVAAVVVIVIFSPQSPTASVV